MSHPLKRTEQQSLEHRGSGVQTLPFPCCPTQKQPRSYSSFPRKQWIEILGILRGLPLLDARQQQKKKTRKEKKREKTAQSKRRAQWADFLRELPLNLLRPLERGAAISSDPQLFQGYTSCLTVSIIKLDLAWRNDTGKSSRKTLKRTRREEKFQMSVVRSNICKHTVPTL